MQNSSETLQIRNAGRTLALFNPEAAAASQSGGDSRRQPAKSVKREGTDTAAKRRKAKSKAEDFPLWFHAASGRWCRTIKKERHYFGKDKDAALTEWLRVKDYILNGRQPPEKDAPADDPNTPTVKLVCDAFLTFKEQQRDDGEIQPRTFDDLHRTCVYMGAKLGKNRIVSDLRPKDFTEMRADLAKRLGLVALSIEIQKIRSVFNFAYGDEDDDDGDRLISRPVRFGRNFKKPTRKALRIERAKKGARDLQADQIRAIIDKAGIPLKAMILLAVNAGFGNNDVGTLPLAEVDLAGGWVSYSRPKTGIARRAKLWPETVAALEAAIAKRPAPKVKSDAGLVFLTKYGAPWAKGESGNDPVGLEFKKLLKDLEFHREGIGFYSLRRTFETVAGDSLDQVAVDVVMGHTPSANDMAAIYRQRVNDARLEAVAAHVRAWLFPAKQESR